MADTIYVRGEGGGVHAMDLPLPDSIAQRMEKGALVRCNKDGSEYTGEAAESEPAPPSERPAQSAPKAEWIGWAVVSGADPEDAEAMTKADLIDQYGGDS